MVPNGPNNTKEGELYPRYQQPVLSPYRHKKRVALEQMSLEEADVQQPEENKLHGAAINPGKRYVLANRLRQIPKRWIQYGAGGLAAVLTLLLVWHALASGPEDAIRVFMFGTVPTCTELVAPGNGTVSYDHKPKSGDTAVYSCTLGFVLSGDPSSSVATRTCVGNDNNEQVKWNGSAPACKLISPYCPKLPHLAHGSVSYDPARFFGANALYSCEPGYKLHGDPNRAYESRKCAPRTAEQGVWTGEEVACTVLEPYCPVPQAPSHGKVTHTGLKLGDTADFSCNYGFAISSADNASVRVCEPGSAMVGTWSGIRPPQCTQPFDNLPFDAAFVVSLPNRTERVMASLATVGIEPISVPAIHPFHLSRHELEGSGVIVPNSPLEMGEIARHLSHLKALEAFVESGYQTAIIFEDDIATPDPRAVEDMAFLAERLPKNWDLFNMRRCADDCSRQEVVEDGLNLVRCYSPRCATAVAFTRRAAEAILAQQATTPMDNSYDEVLAGSVSSETLVAYCAHDPRLFAQRTRKVSSEITSEDSVGSLASQCYRLPPNPPKRMKPLDN